MSEILNPNLERELERIQLQIKRTRLEYWQNKNREQAAASERAAAEERARKAAAKVPTVPESYAQFNLLMGGVLGFILALGVSSLWK